ncbi:MepB family protein [Pedobacter sp. UYP1]|uniref:MepB family protein n=1 Tax=Pedobacter sp. UYP1 TaxID=1756396 RepID=UPI003399F781
MLLKNTKIRVDQNGFPSDLLTAQELIYKPCNFKYSSPVPAAQSADYCAYTFNVKNLAVQYRIAKVTPTKVGQFVTLWKKTGNGPVQPFDYTDDVDLFIVGTRQGDRFGQFIFPKAILQDRGIVSTMIREGKRAIRVYPPWDMIYSRQAQKTQQWQLAYFLEMGAGLPIDLIRTNTLYKDINI